MERNKKAIDFICGETTQETIKAANKIAELLLTGSERRIEIEFQLPNGQKVEGFAFGNHNDSPVIVTDDVIATVNKNDKITQFLPRR